MQSAINMNSIGRQSFTTGFGKAATYKSDMQASDETLLKRCAEGNANALSILAGRHQNAIFRFLARLSPSVQDAEDACLEVFVKAWTHAGGFEYRSSVKTWLFRIAVNIARDNHARRQSRKETVSLDHELAASLESGDIAEDVVDAIDCERLGSVVRTAMATLTENERLILTLYYLNDLSLTEIAQATGLSYTVTKTRLARARTQLRTRVKRGGYTELVD